MTPRDHRHPPTFSRAALRASVLGAALLLACSEPAQREARAAADPETTSAVRRLPPGSPRVRPPAREPDSLPIEELGYDRGSPDAPVKVIELSDFGCGFCRKFNLETYPALQREYVETGKVQWKYVPFVSGMFPNGLQAAVAAECAGEQGGFEAFARRLYEDQKEWKGSADPYALFGSYAEEEGLDVGRFRACIDGGWRDERIRMNMRLGRRVGVRGTPTFVIDGFPIQGALPLQAFREILDLALRDREGAGPPS